MDIYVCTHVAHTQNIIDVSEWSAQIPTYIPIASPPSWLLALSSRLGLHNKTTTTSPTKSMRTIKIMKKMTYWMGVGTRIDRENIFVCTFFYHNVIISDMNSYFSSIYLFYFIDNYEWILIIHFTFIYQRLFDSFRVLFSLRGW